MNGSINVQDRYRRLALYANYCPKISNGDVTGNLSIWLAYVELHKHKLDILLHLEDVEHTQATCKFLANN